MQLIACFGPDPKRCGNHHVSFLLPDAYTSFGRTLSIAGGDAGLIAALGKLGADKEQLAQHLRAWGQGSTAVFPSDSQVQWILGADRPDYPKR